MADKPISEHVWRLVFIVVSILILLLQCTILLLQHKQTGNIRQIHQQLAMQPSIRELLSMTSASPFTEHQFQTAEQDEGNQPPEAAIPPPPANPYRNYPPEQQRKLTTLQTRMEQRYPIAYPGDTVKLREQSGRIRRGIFQGLEEESVLLLQNENIQVIPLERLDRTSRICIDPVFRQKIAIYQLKKIEVRK